MSVGDALTLQLTRKDELPQTLISLKQLNTRAGDFLSLSSEISEDFAFRVETSWRTNHGNKVIRGVNEAGGRLTMVVTSDGQLLIKADLFDVSTSFVMEVMNHTTELLL